MKLENSPVAPAPAPRRFHIWAWAVGIVFLLFAVRSFCWLLWVDGTNLKIQSPNNLGDLSLHITYMKYFANGVALWPDNPIHVYSSLRYPAGIDLFDSLLLLQHIDLVGSGLDGFAWFGGDVLRLLSLGRPFRGGRFSLQRRPCRLRLFSNPQFIDYQAETNRLEKHPAHDVRDPARPALRDPSRAAPSFALAAKILSCFA